MGNRDSAEEGKASIYIDKSSLFDVKSVNVFTTVTSKDKSSISSPYTNILADNPLVITLDKNPENTNSISVPITYKLAIRKEGIFGIFGPTCIASTHGVNLIDSQGQQTLTWYQYTITQGVYYIVSTEGCL